MLRCTVRMNELGSCEQLVERVRQFSESADRLGAVQFVRGLGPFNDWAGIAPIAHAKRCLLIR